jgi:hypothetical protein
MIANSVRSTIIKNSNRRSEMSENSEKFTKELEETSKDIIETLTRRNQMEGDTGDLESKRRALLDEIKDEYGMVSWNKFIDRLIEEREAHARTKAELEELRSKG